MNVTRPFALLLAAVGALSAATVHVRFSDISVAGQSYEGVTLGAMTITSEIGAVTYTPSYGAGLISGTGATSDIYLTFSAPISSITVRGGDGVGDDDAFSLYLYEFGTSNFLGRFDTPVFGGIHEPEWYTLTAAAPNIGKVVFDEGNSGVLPGLEPPFGGVVMTDVYYDIADGVVPEPGTASLLLMSVAGVALLARRRFATR